MNHNVRHFFELLWGMTEKELRARYKYTIFGFIWLVANPILQMLVIGFVFTFFMKEPVEHYYYHLFMGLLVWNFFSLSLSKTTPSIVFDRSLIKKAAFPRSIIPLSIILSNFIHFVLAFSIFMLPITSLGTLSFSSIPYLLIGFCFLIIFTTGISLLTSALNVKFRDINFFVQALLLLWFYATPIIYSLFQMPRDLLWLWRFNPMTSILQLFQHALLGAPAPGLAMLASNIAVIIIITTLGILVFRDESKTFDDWI
jgi:ABC-2 type transport system permease protein